MTTLISENKITGQSAPYYMRTIRCPGHWLVHPSVDVYLREVIPWAKNCSDEVEVKGRRIKIRKMRIVKDAYGRKKVDWKKLYELQKTGMVLNPWISASEAIERIYDPISYLCINCDKRCMEGKGKINIRTIRRLSG